MTLDFPSASTLDGIRFTAQVGLPNVAQGLFAKRALAGRATSALHADEFGYRLVAGLVRRHGPDPIWIDVARERTLLVHHPDDLRIVLGGSPDPFAADPEAKRAGMAAFQPDALTISRGDAWAARRSFAEAVLDTGSPMHRLADVHLALAQDEARRVRSSGPLGWTDIHRAFQRLTRRVVFGDAAVADDALTAELGRLMAAGNKRPGRPTDGYTAFLGRVRRYVDAAEDGSLCSLVAAAPSPGGEHPATQLIHWLFAKGDTLAANVFRTLAVLASHPLQLAEVRAAGPADAGDPAAVAGQEFLAGCLLDTMRLWPTTGLFGRVTTRDVRFPTGAVLPAGSPVLVHNVFNHRNRDRVAFADRFAPEEWVSGSAADDWSFNFFSHGPQGCPGTGLALFLGQAFVGELVGSGELRTNARLRPGRALPYALDVNGLTVTVE